MTRRVNPILVPPLLAALSGCSWLGLGGSQYACPGGATDGARCLSAREVYQATDRTDVVKPTPEGGEPAGAKAATSIAPPLPSGRAAVPVIGQPLPIRTQAQVMRIWIAPWEDEDGDLHADGYVYTEIQGRKWNLGERFEAPPATLDPLNARRR
jgi:conjugal transfer pilus assembly protein TraV